MRAQNYGRVLPACYPRCMLACVYQSWVKNTWYSLPAGRGRATGPRVAAPSAEAANGGRGKQTKVVHTYIPTHSHTYVHTHTHTYPHLCTHTYPHIPTLMYTYIPTHTHTDAHLCTRTHTYPHLCTLPHLCALTHSRARVRGKVLENAFRVELLEAYFDQIVFARASEVGNVVDSRISELGDVLGQLQMLQQRRQGLDRRTCEGCMCEQVWACVGMCGYMCRSVQKCAEVCRSVGMCGYVWVRVCT